MVPIFENKVILFHLQPELLLHWKVRCYGNPLTNTYKSFYIKGRYYHSYCIRLYLFYR